MRVSTMINGFKLFLVVLFIGLNTVACSSNKSSHLVAVEFFGGSSFLKPWTLQKIKDDFTDGVSVFAVTEKNLFNPKTLLYFGCYSDSNTISLVFFDGRRGTIADIDTSVDVRVRVDKYDAHSFTGYMRKENRAVLVADLESEPDLLRQMQTGESIIVEINGGIEYVEGGVFSEFGLPNDFNRIYDIVSAQCARKYDER